MTLKTQTSQVVLLRRNIDTIVDTIVDGIADRRKRRTRTFITVFGNILVTLDEILREIESLQYRNHREITPELREKIIESEKVFASTMLKEAFEELKKLL